MPSPIPFRALFLTRPETQERALLVQLAKDLDLVLVDSCLTPQGRDLEFSEQSRYGPGFRAVALAEHQTDLERFVEFCLRGAMLLNAERTLIEEYEYPYDDLVVSRDALLHLDLRGGLGAVFGPPLAGWFEQFIQRGPQPWRLTRSEGWLAICTLQSSTDSMRLGSSNALHLAPGALYCDPRVEWLGGLPWGSAPSSSIGGYGQHWRFERSDGTASPPGELARLLEQAMSGGGLSPALIPLPPATWILPALSPETFHPGREERPSAWSDCIGDLAFEAIQHPPDAIPTHLWTPLNLAIWGVARFQAPHRELLLEWLPAGLFVSTCDRVWVEQPLPWQIEAVAALERLFGPATLLDQWDESPRDDPS